MFFPKTHRERPEVRHGTRSSCEHLNQNHFRYIYRLRHLGSPLQLWCLFATIMNITGAVEPVSVGSVDKSMSTVHQRNIVEKKRLSRDESRTPNSLGGYFFLSTTDGSSQFAFSPLSREPMSALFAVSLSFVNRENNKLNCDMGTRTN